MTDQSTTRCSIWSEYPAKITRTSGERHPRTWVYSLYSPRAGGDYEIAHEDQGLLDEVAEKAHLKPQGRLAHKARLTTRLIDHQLQTGRPLLICEKEVEEALAASALQVPERARRLLKVLRGFSRPIGKEITLFSQDKPGARPTMTEIGQIALAWSESTTPGELEYLCEHLAKKGWIGVKSRPTDPRYGVVVTVEGHAALEAPPHPRSNKTFVAMWLDESMDKVYEQGIKPGIEAAGYEAFRIDQDKTVDKIDDAIMAGIRGCRFLVADFTHGDDGVRGSVYFEAGFARGLGIEVISTCRKDCVERLHFDTRQYYHIAWEKDKLDKLHNEIADRIRARIGPGSALPRTQLSP